jgi:hypothetical protein
VSFDHQSSKTAHRNESHSSSWQQASLACLVTNFCNARIAKPAKPKAKPEELFPERNSAFIGPRFFLLK